jgi:hypothetical protein
MRMISTWRSRSLLIKVGVPQFPPLPDHPAKDQRGERLLPGAKSPFECTRVHAGEWQKMAEPTSYIPSRSTLNFLNRHIVAAQPYAMPAVTPSGIAQRRAAFVIPPW